MAGRRRVFACVLLVLALAPMSFLSYGSAEDRSLHGVSLNTAISRRMSVRRFSETPVASSVLQEVLWAGYGYSDWERTVPNLCASHPISIYVCDERNVQVYRGENLLLHKEGDFRGLGGFRAPVQLFITWDKARCSSQIWVSMEAGCIGQNIYLAANTLGLGTVLVGGGVNRSAIQDALSLPQGEVVLFNMPLGYPQVPYDFAPAFSSYSSELPAVKEDSVSLGASLLQASSRHDWSQAPVTRQELSQILWAGYGFSLLADLTQPKSSYNITRHRTVPSAYDSYTLALLLLNESGTYRYTPSDHSLEFVREGDARLGVAVECGQEWIGSAPLVLAVVWDSDGSPRMNMNFAAIEVGCVIQNVRLEAVSWGMISDSIPTSDDDGLSMALGIAGRTNLHPMSLIAVGKPSTYWYKVLNATSIVTVSTNSTVTDFVFEREKAERRTIDEGSYRTMRNSGTVGFCNVTFPLMVGLIRPTVLIDEMPVDYLMTRNSTHLSLYFTFDQGFEHTVQVIVGFVDPPSDGLFAAFVTVVMGVVAGVVAALLVSGARRKRFIKVRGRNAGGSDGNLGLRRCLFV